jgi:hypothetical protein
MDYVRRELPVTIPPAKRASSRMSRYVLADNYLRFYFRFVRPHLDLLAQRLYDVVEQRIAEQLRAFIGMTTFEELCREWILTEARAGRLPFMVEQVGAHWSSKVQVDVVAANWRDKQLLLGEAKWQTDRVSRRLLRELVEDKTLRVLATLPDEGKGWDVHYAFFARAGFTEEAGAFADKHAMRLVDLIVLDNTLLAAE